MHILFRYDLYTRCIKPVIPCKAEMETLVSSLLGGWFVTATDYKATQELNTILLRFRRQIDPQDAPTEAYVTGNLETCVFSAARLTGSENDFLNRCSF